jgi:hypothetical protein
MLAPSHRSEIELVQVSAKGSWIVHANRHHSYSIHGHPHAQCGRAYRPRHPSHRSRRRRQRFWSRWKPYPEGSVEAAGSLSLGRCPVLTTSESSRRIHRNRCRQALEENCITSNKFDFGALHGAPRVGAPPNTKSLPLAATIPKAPLAPGTSPVAWAPKSVHAICFRSNMLKSFDAAGRNGTLHQLYAEGNIKPEQ